MIPMDNLNKFSEKNVQISTKFVPWEPYKAATNRNSLIPDTPPTFLPPIVQYRLKSPLTTVPERTKIWSNSEISILDDRSSLAEADGAEAPEMNFSANRQKINYDNIIKKLTNEKEVLANELDLQKKVNEELKRLLVATMGEDLQSHVSSLSHDKVLLAENMSVYSEKQNADREKVDDLAIFGDIWRSKFLATSVMMDELITARMSLLKFLQTGQNTVRQLLQDQDFIRRHLFQILFLLTSIMSILESPSESVTNPKLFTCPTTFELITNVHSLCDSLLQKVVHKVIHSNSSASNRSKFPSKFSFTPAEEEAVRFLTLDLTTFCPNSPCDEFTNKKQNGYYCLPMTDIRNMTISCCKNCAGRELRLV